MISESRLGYKRILDQLISSFNEYSVLHVGLPDVENFRYCIILEKLDVCYNVKHRALMHPVR